MKILIYSPQFYPRLGGVEQVTQLLAQNWGKLGQTVKVITFTPTLEPELACPFELIRHPTFRQQIQLLQWCDLFVQSCISLKGLWPWFLVRKPLAMIHHTWYRRPDGRVHWQDWLKLQATRLGQNIAVSRAIAAHLPVSATVIENPYADDIFVPQPGILRDRDLIFVGRLVSDKGVDLLIAAVAQLRDRGFTPDLTIIGTGPEKQRLERQIEQLELRSQITFLGVLSPPAIAHQLCQHRILVIPSRWQEPFGIVALEGLACGCTVVGSNQGGLADAIGPDGLTFNNGNLAELTLCLERALTTVNPSPLMATLRQQHLQQHQQAAIAQQYLEQFHSLRNGGRDRG